LVAHNGTSLPNAQELRVGLSKDLPEYMIPNDYVVLEELPLSSHGKLDKKRLPAPLEHAHLSTYVAPVSASEKLLCELFSEVTHVDQVGIHDNFFVIGGHSLLAMRLIARIRQKTDKTISLRSVFELTTPAMLATALDVEDSDDGMQLISGLGRMNDDD